MAAASQDSALGLANRDVSIVSMNSAKAPGQMMPGPSPPVVKAVSQ